MATTFGLTHGNRRRDILRLANRRPAYFLGAHKVAAIWADACVNHTPQKHVSRNGVGKAGGTARHVLELSGPMSALVWSSSTSQSTPRVEHKRIADLRMMGLQHISTHNAVVRGVAYVTHNGLLCDLSAATAWNTRVVREEADVMRVSSSHSPSSRSCISGRLQLRIFNYTPIAACMSALMETASHV